MKNHFTIILLCFVLHSTSWTQNIEDTVTIFGRDRFYKVHLPINYNYQKEYPVVFVFHGGLGNPDNIEQTTSFSSKADKEDFIVVYPYGTGAFPKKLLTWNTWDCCGYADKNDINDVEFINLVLKKVKEKYRVNDRMIYATGLSNGGMMCYLIACELSDKFAAVAPVAATMFNVEQCSAGSEISMIIFNSIDDKHIPYEGGIGEGSIVRAEKMPVEKVVDFWKEKFNCGFFNKSDSPNFHRINYGNGNGTEIIFYKMLKGGHSWPGGERGRPGADKPVKEVSATDLIWEFFKTHPKR